MSNSVHPVVIIDTSLRDLIPQFLRNKRAAVVGAVAAIDLDEFDRASEVGHQLKGEGGTYGFSVLTDMGRDFEEAASSGNRAKALEWARQILDYLDTVEVRFSEDAD